MLNKKQIKLIEDTLIPYFKDPSTCGWERNTEACLYLTSAGNKCAIGKLMDTSSPLYAAASQYGGASTSLFTKYPKSSILIKEAQDIPDHILSTMQGIHDSIPTKKLEVDYIDWIEKDSGSPLPRLRKAFERWKAKVDQN